MQACSGDVAMTHQLQAAQPAEGVVHKGPLALAERGAQQAAQTAGEEGRAAQLAACLCPSCL